MRICDRCDKKATSKPVTAIEARQGGQLNQLTDLAGVEVDLCDRCLKELRDMVQSFLVTKEPKAASAK